MSGFFEGLFSKALWEGMKAARHSLDGGRIRITSPRPGELLNDVQKSSNGVMSFRVRGTLKKLPKDHRVWLLTGNDISGDVWPQSFSPVDFNRDTGTWERKVNVMGRSHVRIIAVVAPPTSQDFFVYYQTVGKARNIQFTPLVRVPPECINQDSVQARLPEK